MSRYIIAILLVLLLCVPLLSVAAYADEPDEAAPDTEPDEAAPDTEPDEAAPDTEPDEAAPDTEPDEAAPDTEPDEAAPIIATREVEASYFYDDDSQLSILEIIEFHLRVLVVIVLMVLAFLVVWFLILKPITYFIL